jgi:hypothetical protein
MFLQTFDVADICPLQRLEIRNRMAEVDVSLGGSHYKSRQQRVAAEVKETLLDCGTTMVKE